VLLNNETDKTLLHSSLKYHLQLRNVPQKKHVIIYHKHGKRFNQLCKIVDPLELELPYRENP